MRLYATLLFVLVAGIAVADEVTWTPPHQIRVMVVDRDSGPVPGVAVTVRQVDSRGAAQGLVAITDDNGSAAFKKLPRGSTSSNSSSRGLPRPR